jgi:signal transduction histidine kinase
VGYTDLLAQGSKGPLSAEQLQSINRIHRSAESLLGLIDDILDMSRAEQGQLSIAPRKMRVESVVEDAVEEHAASAASSGHRIDVDVPADLPAVTTDPQRVRQVLGNLLSNAIKYTPPGGSISVRSSVKTRDDRADGKHWVAIQVVDGGPGIPDDKTSAIFDEFSRLEIHRDKPGSGLGLAIALRVARLLGGEITVGRAEGGGSVFTLWLPVEATDTRRRGDEEKYATSAASF